MASLPAPTGWPSVTWEEHEWRPRYPDGVYPRGSIRRQTGTYQAAVVPVIATQNLELPDTVSALADEASAEIVRFDAEMGAELAPFAAVLLRSESAASSQIEHITASARAIALAEIGDSRRRNATEVVGNTRAMQAAVALAHQLDADAILAMHAALTQQTDPELAGRWRTEQVWIGRIDLGPLDVDFVPPHHDRIRPAIDDLLAFVARTDLPAFAQAAVAHAQFETIHPFADGNGRTGRALVHAMLRARGLTRNVTVPVSAGLLTDTRAYIDALTSYRDGAVGHIVRLMAQASFGAIANGRHLVRDLRRIRDSWAEVVTARRDSAVWRVIDLLLRQPVVDSETLRRELGITVGNVSRYLRPLEDAGIVVESTGAKRDRIWRADAVLGALDAFAARAGRRTLG